MKDRLFRRTSQEAQKELRSGSAAEAARLMTRYVRGHPDDPRGWDRLRAYLHAVGDEDGAREADRKLLDLCGASDDPRFHNVCLYATARRAADERRIADLVAVTSTALEEAAQSTAVGSDASGSVTLAYQLGVTLWEVLDPTCDELADAALNLVIDRDPESCWRAAMMLAVMYEASQPDRSRRYLETAVRFGPKVLREEPAAGMERFRQIRASAAR